jgi:hypothetical protein
MLLTCEKHLRRVDRALAPFKRAELGLADQANLAAAWPKGQHKHEDGARQWTRES